MYTLSEETKKFYIENKEQLELRKYQDMERLEDYLKTYDMMILSKEAFAEWGKVWEMAESYWIFPDEEDMKKMVNSLYALHQGNNAVQGSNLNKGR